MLKKPKVVIPWIITPVRWVFRCYKICAHFSKNYFALNFHLRAEMYHLLTVLVLHLHLFLG